jgi:hypothetical protein
MSDRRPLTASLNTLPNIDPAAARAFVTQEKPPADDRPGIAKAPAARDEPARSRPASPEEARRPAKKARPSGITPVGLIPVTVRLRPEVAGGLKRASLERELAGEEPYTQQELVEQLLEPWLRDNGYLA